VLYERECYRTLQNGGIFLIAVTHPKFVGKLQKDGQLRRTSGQMLTMPGTGSLRLPIIIRPLEIYQQALAEAGFIFKLEDVYATTKVINEKPVLHDLRRIPVALLIRCSK
jgi:hypothetical protein